MASPSPKTGSSKPDSPVLSFSMAPKKTVPEKRTRKGSSSVVPPPPHENPKKIITLEAEKLYHESLYNRTLVAEHGFPDSNVYFKFLIQEKGWTKFCEHPPPRIAPVVWESNLRYWMDSAVYVRGKWVDFSVATIKRVFNLVDDDNEAYRALFYHTMMQVLTNSRGVWKRHPSTSEVTTYLMSALKLIPKAW